MASAGQETAMTDWAVWLAAIGTIAVAVMAIWGDWVRSKLTRPNVAIEGRSLRGDVAKFPNGARAIFYHLQVRNRRGWSPARNCRVLLTTLHRRGPDGQFRREPMPVPFQFIWSPKEFSGTLQTVTDHTVLDFGLVVEGSDRFTPSLYVIPYNFPGYVKRGEAVRYTLQAVGDNFASELVTYEVAWDGEWSDNLDMMAGHLTIRRVTQND